MRHSLSQIQGDNAGVLPWIVVGAAGGAALYFLFRGRRSEIGPRSGETRAAPVAPVAPPSRFANLESIDLRFGQLRELYRMGYKSPQETVAELDALATAAQSFPAQAEDARALQARIESFKADVEEFMRAGAAAMSGRPAAGRVPVVNLPRRHS